MIPLSKQESRTQGQAVEHPPAHRVVSKPVPDVQARDPRGFQIEQLRRRFSPRNTTLSDGTTSLNFKLKPSDPDFPFDLEFLECDLRVPGDYPSESTVLHVKNRNIPRGFCINIERGWTKLVEQKQGATLLALTYALDKNLESFLSEQKAETVTLMSFKDTRHHDIVSASPLSTAIQAPMAAAVSTAPPKLPLPREPSYSQDQMKEAKERRAREVRQVETRMSRLSLYRRSGDGIVYTLPVEPKRRSELPQSLQTVQSLHMIVPLLYPLQPLRIQLNEVDSDEAEPLEDLFVEKAAHQKHLSLISHLNFLSQNIHTLAKQANAQAQARDRAMVSEQNNSESPPSSGPHGKAQGTDIDIVLEDRGHVKVIARPPEWILQHGIGGDTSSEDDLGFESDDDGAGAPLDDVHPALTSGSTPERGIAVSFPGIELYNIELFQLSILNISVKCTRCKTINDMTGLQNEKEKTASCRKCAAGIAACFRPQLVHQASHRAGFLDIAGATVADMLPSTFTPVCAKCSTASPGLVSVRGEATTNVCRDCHGKFTFKITDVRFLAYAPGALSAPAAGNRRKQDRIGLQAGEALPDRGACPHYRKSYRWFRFSCCNRVHPCDKCHDAAEDHVNEWANRMVCGWCSREQRYAVDACSFCGRSVIGRRGTGFWEGGKGTRDRTLMSRKDPRKFKRVGASSAAKKE